MKYKLVIAFSASELSTKVSKLLNMGYVMAAPPDITRYTQRQGSPHNKDILLYSQAVLFLDKQPEPNINLNIEEK